MGLLVGLVLLVVGGVFLLQAWRADHAVRRWPRTTGVIRQASQGRATDDGRRWWDVLVTYRTDAGEDIESWGKRMSGDADTLTGRTVDVWYDPRKPERSHTALEGASPGSSWMQYVFGLVFAVAGAAVLVWAFR
jgi:hypothetical protein